MSPIQCQELMILTDLYKVCAVHCQELLILSDFHKVYCPVQCQEFIILTDFHKVYLFKCQELMILADFHKLCPVQCHEIMFLTNCCSVLIPLSRINDTIRLPLSVASSFSRVSDTNTILHCTLFGAKR